MIRQKEKVRILISFLKKSFLTVIGVAVIYFVFALLFSFLPTHPPSQDCNPEFEVYIATNGVHLDIIFPVENLDPQILQKLDKLPETLFIAFGWGDKEFYIKTPEWSDLTFPVAFRALFLKSETAMHVTYLPWALSEWKKIRLCSWQLDRLNRYIENSFQKNEYGNFILLDFDGYSRFDSFYNAQGSFSLFRTCNVWVNVALKEIEIKTSVWSPFDLGVLFHVQKE